MITSMGAVVVLVVNSNLKQEIKIFKSQQVAQAKIQIVLFLTQTQLKRSKEADCLQMTSHTKVNKIRVKKFLCNN
jgi:hypothetical protein